MSHMEMMLRLSLVQVELTKIAEALDPKEQRVVLYAVNVMNLLRDPFTPFG